MVPTIALAHAGGTTGEWAGALREVFGEYRAPTGVSGARRPPRRRAGRGRRAGRRPSPRPRRPAPAPRRQARARRPLQRRRADRRGRPRRRLRGHLPGHPAHARRRSWRPPATRTSTSSGSRSCPGRHLELVPEILDRLAGRGRRRRRRRRRDHPARRRRRAARQGRAPPSTRRRTSSSAGSWTTSSTWSSATGAPTAGRPSPGLAPSGRRPGRAGRASGAEADRRQGWWTDGPNERARAGGAAMHDNERRDGSTLTIGNRERAMSAFVNRVRGHRLPPDARRGRLP